MKMAVVVVVLLALAVALITDTEDRLPCNSRGEVRYSETTKYVCEQTLLDGLRWTGRWR